MLKNKLLKKYVNIKHNIYEKDNFLHLRSTVVFVLINI
jgi:hypothetical protein